MYFMLPCKSRVYLKCGIRNPESGIKKQKQKFVDMKISTKVKVTWETAFIALDKLLYNISQEPSEIFKSLPKISIAAVKPMVLVF